MYPRNLLDQVLAALSDTPVVVLNGARQTGKSTLAKHLLAHAYPADYMTLDDLSILGMARRDPAGFLEGHRGALIVDEVQRAPDLLLAIKEAVDRDRRPGRFLLTGSAHMLNLPRLADVLVGRSELLTLWPLSQGELLGYKEAFVDTLFRDALPEIPPCRTASADLWTNHIVPGGYPEAIARQEPARRRAWYESYLNTLLLRDVRDLSNVAGLADFPKFLELLAARAGSLINYADAARDAGLNKITLKRYFTLLQAVFLVHTVRPWFTNRIKRLMKSEKLYLCDTGLLVHLLDFTFDQHARNDKVRGAILENFVAMELLKQLSWSQIRPRIYHFRDYQGTEVDFLLETPGGRQLVGIEVKAASMVNPEDVKGLQTLAETLGDHFVRGVVLYMGREAISLGKNLHALPIESLWFPCPK
ncbi:MAG TPA: ATP-binding protein [Candidatus Hydrogenedentes bacterium]|nr:ATP-binding protein [Candidatus Hydrogenedentota bacterium]